MTSAPMDIMALREDFPILRQQAKGNDLVYLDNAATTQKPQCVIDTLAQYYQTQNANVHRGNHYLSDLATEKFEAARKTVQRFINAPSAEQIIWTRGTTESINLVAFGLSQGWLQSGDEILISAMEHHANIVPWQQVAQRTGVTLKVIPVTDQAELDLDAYASLLSERTKLVAVTQVSNALGTINPVSDMIQMAHAVGALVLVDAAQSVPHWDIDVQALDCDFLAFSGHKLFGPTGIGVLYGKAAILETMAPFQTGGEMIERVSFSGTTFNEIPFKFEAGTPNIAGAIGLAAAMDYLSPLDREALARHEHQLLDKCLELAQSIPQLQVIGRAKQKAGIFSFLITGTHPQDLGTLLDQQGIAIRTGHHCAMPIMEQFNIPGTARAYFAFYNTQAEVEQLFVALNKAVGLLL